MILTLRHRIGELVCVLLAGCTTFQSRPLSPTDIASAFERRTLDEPGLKRYIDANTHRTSPTVWNLETLSLAALYFHPDLDVARAQRAVADAGVISAGARPNPGVSASLEKNMDASAGTSPWTRNLGLDIPIETAGKRDARVEQAQSLAQTARLHIAVIAWQVRSRVRTQLLDLYAAQQRATLLQQQHIAQADLVRLLEQRLTAGMVSRPDVTQARIAFAQSNIALTAAQQQAAEARAALAAAVGVPLHALRDLAIVFDDFQQTPAVVELSPQTLRREALLARADLLAALADYAAAESALRLEIARQYPDVNLAPGYSWDAGAVKWSLGVSLLLPVLNHNQGPIAEADARRAEQAARFTALQARVLGDIDQALTGYQAARRQQSVAESLLDAQISRQHAINAQFDAGEVDRLALASARQELLDAARARLDARVQMQRSVGALEDALQQPLAAHAVYPAFQDINPRHEVQP